MLHEKAAIGFRGAHSKGAPPAEHGLCRKGRVVRLRPHVEHGEHRIKCDIGKVESFETPWHEEKIPEESKLQLPFARIARVVCAGWKGGGTLTNKRGGSRLAMDLQSSNKATSVRLKVHRLHVCFACQLFVVNAKLGELIPLGLLGLCGGALAEAHYEIEEAVIFVSRGPVRVVVGKTARVDSARLSLNHVLALAAVVFVLAVVGINVAKPVDIFAAQGGDAAKAVSFGLGGRLLIPIAILVVVIFLSFVVGGAGSRTRKRRMVGKLEREDPFQFGCWDEIVEERAAGNSDENRACFESRHSDKGGSGHGGGDLGGAVHNVGHDVHDCVWTLARAVDVVVSRKGIDARGASSGINIIGGVVVIIIVVVDDSVGVIVVIVIVIVAAAVAVIVVVTAAAARTPKMAVKLAHLAEITEEEITDEEINKKIQEIKIYRFANPDVLNSVCTDIKTLTYDESYYVGLLVTVNNKEIIVEKQSYIEFLINFLFQIMQNIWQ